MEEAAPNQATFPCVSTLQRIVPPTPSGWLVKVRSEKTLGVINAANRISATARLAMR